MPSAFWIFVILFLVGFLHGLHSDHVQEILAQYDRNVFYRRIARISLEAIMDHLRLFSPVLLGVVFLRLILKETSEYTFLPFIAFWGFAHANLYLFFFRKISLHQHDHDHSHEHGHDHDEPKLSTSLHPDGHDHPLPKDIDEPKEPEISHSHDHDHSHSHLHLHEEGDTSKHKQHRHSPKILERFFELRNLSALFLLATIVIIYPLSTGGIGVGVFLCGAYFSIYLLSIISLFYLH